MARIVKCQWCTLSDTPRSDMEVIVVGVTRKVNKYYHKHCLQDYLDDKKFKEEETIKKDSLIDTICDIFDVSITQFNTQIYISIEDVRNGTNNISSGGGSKRNSYKEGYPYEIIEEAFLKYKDDIRYWISRNNIQDFYSRFRYGLAIVMNHIDKIEKNKKSKERNREHIESISSSMEPAVDSFVSNYKKKSKEKDSKDISSFLD